MIFVFLSLLWVDHLGGSDGVTGKRKVVRTYRWRPRAHSVTTLIRGKGFFILKYSICFHFQLGLYPSER